MTCCITSRRSGGFHRQTLRKLGWAVGLVLLALLVTVQPASAVQVRGEQAFEAAVRWSRLPGQPMGRDMGEAARVATVADAAGDALFHVVEFAPAGYVVLAADDELEPVLAFSHGDQFVAQPGHPLFELLRRDVVNRRAKLNALTRAAEAAVQRAEHRRKWDSLLSPPSRATTYATDANAQARAVADVNDRRVDPLVQSRWGQSSIVVNGSAVSVYNYYTPPYAAGDRRNYPAGCPATAIGQIMRFHQWPKAGVGVRSEEINVDGVWQQRALRGGDGLGGPYDWANMVLVPDATTTEAQRAAIGALLHDIGVALPTTYTASGSGAMTAFPARFGYESVSTVVMTETDKVLRWEQVLMAVRANLDAALPVLLSINGTVGGHSVVCDGYGYNLATLYHHLNMGWNGADNAWYNLPSIDSAGAAFDTISACHSHISPNPVGEIISGRISDDDGAPLAGVKVTISGSSTHTATTNARGIFAVTGISSREQWTITPQATGYAFNPAQRIVETSRMIWTSSTSGIAGTGDRIADFSAYLVGSTARRTPVINWAQPAAIFAGTELTSTQLNATADVPGTFSYTPAAGTVFDAAGTYLLSVTFTPADAGNYRTTGIQVPVEVLNPAPSFTVQSDDQTVPVGGRVVLAVDITGGQNPAFQWQRDGRDIAGATNTVLVLDNVQPGDAGLYSLSVSWGPPNNRQALWSARMIVGVTTTAKVQGAGRELEPTNIQHPNGKVFDQVQLTGAAALITADAGQVTRTSFIDPDNDIVQVEFSGPGTLALVIDGAAAPGPPVNYNQQVDYVKGLARIVISGANENTHVSVFSVGRKTAVNQALFKSDVEYGGIADIASIVISSSNGKFGGVRTANTHYFAYQGLTGVYAPDVAFAGPVYIGNIVGYGSALPVILLGSVGDKSLITGGDLLQTASWAVMVAGLTRLEFVDGQDSHGRLLPAKANQARLFEIGSQGFKIITDDIVVNPVP